MYVAMLLSRRGFFWGGGWGGHCNVDYSIPSSAAIFCFFSKLCIRRTGLWVWYLQEIQYFPGRFSLTFCYLLAKPEKLGWHSCSGGCTVVFKKPYKASASCQCYEGLLHVLRDVRGLCGAWVAWSKCRRAHYWNPGFWWENPGRKPFGRPRRRWEDLKMGLKEVRRAWPGCFSGSE